MQDMISEIPETDRPIAERFRLLTERRRTAMHEFELLKELEETEMERRKTVALQTMADLGEKPTEAGAKRMVVASDDWEDYLRKKVAAKVALQALEDEIEALDKEDWWARQFRADVRQEKRFLGRGV